MKSASAKSSASHDLESRLKEFEKQYDCYIDSQQKKLLLATNNNHQNTKTIQPMLSKPSDPHIKSLQRNLIDSFCKALTMIKKCENCDCHSPAFRKDGFTKIFQKPLNKRLRKLAGRKKMQVRIF